MLINLANFGRFIKKVILDFVLHKIIVTDMKQNWVEPKGSVRGDPYVDILWKSWPRDGEGGSCYDGTAIKMIK